MDTNGTLEGPLRGEALCLLNLTIHDRQALGTVTVINNLSYLSQYFHLKGAHYKQSCCPYKYLSVVSRMPKMPSMPQLISASRCCDIGPTFTVEVYQVRPYVDVRAKAALSYQLLQYPECWSS